MKKRREKRKKKKFADQKIYTTESKWGKLFNNSSFFPCVLLLSTNIISRIFLPLDTTALAAAAMGIVPFKLGPGAMGARWSGSNGFFGSTMANRTAANPATRNWGTTMKMLWIPFLGDQKKNTTNQWKKKTHKDNPRF